MVVDCTTARLPPRTGGKRSSENRRGSDGAPRASSNVNVSVTERGGDPGARESEGRVTELGVPGKDTDVGPT